MNYEFVCAFGLAILALALVWHWSAFLALWLSTHGGYISNFLALSPIFLLLVWQIWLFSPFYLGVVNDSCTEHIYYCKQMDCTAGQYLALA